MEPYFKIRNYIGSDGLQQIQLYYSNKGRVLLLDTGVRTKENCWNGKSVTSKCQEFGQDQEQLNDLLRICKTKIENIILNYKFKYLVQPDIDYVKEEYYKEAIKIEQDQDVKKVLEKWIEESKYRLRSIKIYTTILNNLKEVFPKKLFFRDINMQFKNKLLEYWLSEKLQNSTINKRMKCLKYFLRYQYKEGINDYDTFERFKTDLKHITISIIIPTDKEFQLLVSKKITDKRLSYIRALYVISCTTGLRFSDCVRLSPLNILNENGGNYIITNIEKQKISYGFRYLILLISF